MYGTQLFDQDMHLVSYIGLSNYQFVYLFIRFSLSHYIYTYICIFNLHNYNNDNNNSNNNNSNNTLHRHGHVPPIKSLTCQNLHGWISQLYTLKARPLIP